MKTFLTIIAAALLTGCGTVKVPTNTLLFKTQFGQLAIEHPQDFTGTNLSVKIETNGTVTANFGYIKTANSPEVIDKVSAGQVAILKQQGENAEKLFKAGAEAGGILVGKGAHTAVTGQP